MAERWTKQRRVERTRDLLLDAAEEVFALRGYKGAALEDIPDAAVYQPFLQLVVSGITTAAP
jgi:AcrR family transcriptional regulator